MDFEEFCAATLSVRQLEDLSHWEQLARSAYELFEKDGNRPIMIEELASVRSINHIFTTCCDYNQFDKIFECENLEFC